MPIVTASLSLQRDGEAIYAKLQEYDVTLEVYYPNYTLVTASTDVSVAISPLATIRVFVITSDVAITYRLDSITGTLRTLQARRVAVIVGDAITGLWLSNASGATANIKIYFGGV